VPAAAFAISSFLSLKQKGEPTSGWEDTTKLIESGVYRIVRHPLYLGGALFTGGMLLLVQSLFAALVGMGGIFCYWMASRKEDEFNIRKFGEGYKAYMERVPLWNFINGYIKLKT
jgi:protein-S-isoprenylcysteine O-methyltransferase Ste14